MKILVVSGSFYPENSPRSFRTTELVKEFSRLGHEVTVYVPEYECDYSDFLKSYSNVKLHQMNCVNEKRTFIISERISYLWFRFKNLFFESPYLPYYFKLKKVLENECGYDMLVSVAVPHPIHWGIGRIYKKRKLAETWAADCGDPFMLAPTFNIPKMFYFKWFEKLWCRKCDYIVVPTDTSYKGYYPEFRDKIWVIPQGFDFDAVAIPKYKKNNVPTFAYAGSFIKGWRDPRPLLEFLCTVKAPFKFIMYNKGGEALVASYKEKLGDKLEILAPIPRNELLPKLAQMDFLINIGNGTNVQTPSKLIDYTLAKRPILTIETNDIKENVLKEFLEGNYEHKDADIDISRYDIHNVARQFINLCK